MRTTSKTGPRSARRKTLGALQKTRLQQTRFPHPAHPAPAGFKAMASEMADEAKAEDAGGMPPDVPTKASHVTVLCLRPALTGPPSLLLQVPSDAMCARSVLPGLQLSCGALSACVRPANQGPAHGTCRSICRWSPGTSR